MDNFEAHSKSVILHYFLHLEFCAKLFCKRYDKDGFYSFLGNDPKKDINNLTINYNGIILMHSFHGAGGHFELNGKHLHFDRATERPDKNYSLGGVYSYWKPDTSPKEEFEFMEKSRELGIMVRRFPPETLPPSAAAIPGWGGYVAPWIPELFADSVLMK